MLHNAIVRWCSPAKRGKRQLPPTLLYRGLSRFRDAFSGHSEHAGSVELLFAVRVILGRREVVAEPFLVVGIIASIKEIIVLSVEAADYVGQPQKFTHSIIEVGVLGVLVLVLAVAAIMLRAKEREPAEGQGDSDAASVRTGEPVDVQQGDPTGS